MTPRVAALAPMALGKPGLAIVQHRETLARSRATDWWHPNATTRNRIPASVLQLKRLSGRGRRLQDAKRREREEFGLFGVGWKSCSACLTDMGTSTASTDPPAIPTRTVGSAWAPFRNRA